MEHQITYITIIVTVGIGALLLMPLAEYQQIKWLEYEQNFIEKCEALNGTYFYPRCTYPDGTYIILAMQGYI